MLAALLVVGVQGREAWWGIRKWVGRSKCHNWVCNAAAAVLVAEVAVVVAEVIVV